VIPGYTRASSSRHGSLLLQIQDSAADAAYHTSARSAEDSSKDLIESIQLVAIWAGVGSIVGCGHAITSQDDILKPQGICR
jgi:hypothetical protein